MERLCALSTRTDFRARAERCQAVPLIERIMEQWADCGDAAQIEQCLDELDDRFAGIGIAQLTGSVRNFRPLPPTASHPVLRAWVCPVTDRRCTRAIPDNGSDEATVCALTGRPLLRVDLA